MTEKLAAPADSLSPLIAKWREQAKEQAEISLQPHSVHATAIEMTLEACADDLEAALAAAPVANTSRLRELAEHARYSGSFNMTAEVAELVLAALAAAPADARASQAALVADTVADVLAELREQAVIDAAHEVMLALDLHESGALRDAADARAPQRAEVTEEKEDAARKDKQADANDDPPQGPIG